MARLLSDFKLGDWVLSVDLLGTVEKMSQTEWFDSLVELLSMISIAIQQALDLGRSKSSTIAIIQYGDTISFCHNDSLTLIELGIRLQEKLFDSNNLAQIGLSGAGGYYLEDTTIHSKIKGLTNVKLHCLVGRGFARSHLLFRGVKGPRFLIDEEKGNVPINEEIWERFPKRKQLKENLIKCSEVFWWRNMNNIQKTVKDRIDTLEKEISNEKDEQENHPHLKETLERKIHSLKNRLDHYNAFDDLIKD